MKVMARQGVLLLCSLALWGMAPAHAVRASAPAGLTGRWTMVSMPSHQGIDPPNSGGGIAYSRENGAPTWLLATRRGLVAFGAIMCCSTQPLGTEWLSPNGRTWQQISLPPVGAGQVSIQSVAAGPAGLVAVGWRFSPGTPRVAPYQPVVWFSPNDRTWRRAASVGNALAHGQMVSVTANGRGFVAVGYIDSPGSEFSPQSTRMAVWVSPGGGRWQLVSGTGPVFENANASVILHGRNGLVALGVPRNAPGGVTDATAIVWTSRDGRSWRRISGLPTSFPASAYFQLQGAAGAGGRLVAVATSEGEVPQHVVWTSMDGTHWTRAPGIVFQYGTASSIAPYGAGFVTLGMRDNEPTLWSSRDGAHWAPSAGEDVFGGGDTRLGGVAEWKGTLVVVGTYNKPLSSNSTQISSGANTGPVYTPRAWLYRQGAHGQSLPQWRRTDPKWFRLRIEDMPIGFHVSAFGPAGYFIGCDLIPDLLWTEVTGHLRPERRVPADVGTPCRQALAALGTYLAYYYRFPYGAMAFTNSENAPYAGGFAILAQSPAAAQAAFRHAGGLIHAVDLNLNQTPPRPIRSLAIGQQAELFSQTVTSTCPGTPPQCPPFAQGGTAYGVVWRDGAALGVVEVIGVPVDRQALAVNLAERQWARRRESLKTWTRWAGRAG